MISIVTFIHVAHVLAAGIWLGGLIFTTTVVTPAFKRMSWTPVERIAVRSEVGRQYTRVARFNLAVLLLAAIADAFLVGWSTLAISEVVVIAIIVLLSKMHASVFAPRLGQAARSGNESARRRALRISITVSMFNILLSLVVAVLAIQLIV